MVVKNILHIQVYWAQEYRIRSNSWKFYLIKIAFTFRLFKLEQIFFGVQSVDIVRRCTTSHLLARPACLWHVVYLLFCSLTHETRTINSGGLLVANHLDQLLCVNQKCSPIVKSYLLCPFRRLLLATTTCTIMMSQTVFMTQAGIDILTFLHPILLCKSHTKHLWRCSYTLNY
jgi:hypothetical protein